MLLIDNRISFEKERLLNCSCSSTWTKNGLDNSEGGCKSCIKTGKILLGFDLVVTKTILRRSYLSAKNKGLIHKTGYRALRTNEFIISRRTHTIKVMMKSFAGISLFLLGFCSQPVWLSG